MEVPSVTFLRIMLRIRVDFDCVFRMRACNPVESRGMGGVPLQPVVRRPYYTNIHFDFGCVSFSLISQLLVHDTLKLICQRLAHFENWSISIWMMHWSSRDVTCLYKRESSAKRRKVDLMSLFISFIIRKSRGPRTILWGTPETTGSLREWDPSTTTLWVLFVSQLFTHIRSLSLSPLFCKLNNNRLNTTLSNAFAKSRMIRW